MNKVKLSLILLCGVFAVTCLAGCGKNGTGSTNTDTVLTVGGADISYDEYRYFYMNYKAEDSSYSEQELYDLSIAAITSNVATEKLAEKYGVKFDSDDKKALESYVDSAIESYGGKDAYYASLKENYLTGDLFRYLYKMQITEQNLRDYMLDEANDIIRSDDATFEADLAENFMAAKQILIQNDDGDDKETNYALACEILARIQNGEDFDTLAYKFSEDKRMDATYGYYFTYGQMLTSFEEAVKTLDIGEVYASVVESEIGYHVILRMPLDEQYINKNYEDLRYCFKTRRFNEMKQEEADSLEIVKCDGFDNLTFE